MIHNNIPITRAQLLSNFERSSSSLLLSSCRQEAAVVSAAGEREEEEVLVEEQAVVRRPRRIIRRRRIKCQAAEGTIKTTRTPTRTTSSDHDDDVFSQQEHHRRSLFSSRRATLLLLSTRRTTNNTITSALLGMITAVSISSSLLPSSQSSRCSAATTTTPTTTEAGDGDDIVELLISKKELLNRGGLGIELADVEYMTSIRVYVKSIKPLSFGEELGIQKDWIIVSINDTPTERTNSRGVSQILSTTIQNTASYSNIRIRFRDTTYVNRKLRSMGTEIVEQQGSADGDGNGSSSTTTTTSSVTTTIAPAGDTTQRNRDGSVKSGRSITSQNDQKLTITQLTPPPTLCKRGAEVDDLLEISYTGIVVETGQRFDGSESSSPSVRGGNDDTIYFVLGRQPYGQFPPGWDVGLIGMCVGERRRIILPPVLTGYGQTGLSRRNIPPNSTLQYDITLISVNGLATAAAVQ